MRFLGSALIAAMLASAVAEGQEAHRLKVGVTIHPYYSWVSNIVGKAPVDVIPVVQAAGDIHNYQATPEDLKRLSDLDALVVNGLGHDDFIQPMIEASGNKKLRIINPNLTLPLIPYQRGKFHSHGGEEKEAAPRRAVAYNPHTFLSLTAATQQVYAIERELSALLPDQKDVFRANAMAYARKLRQIKAEASEKLAKVANARVATVHDGYCYLLQEFGIEIVSVIEPAHGVEPSAKELMETIDVIRAAKVGVVFSELNFPKRLVDVIEKETNARVYTFDHMSQGEYTPERFERAMRTNVDILVKALVPEGREH